MDFSIGFGVALAGGALAAGMGAAGSAIGCGLAGEMAAGVLSEDPDKFGQMLILQALPGTQAIYSLVVAILVMVKLQVFGGTGGMYDLPLAKGIAVFAACMPCMLGEFVSAIWQGRASVGAAGLVAKRPDAFGKAVILPALVETFALLSLIATILLLMIAIQL
jgi:V/A-type H+/Na+-transporting ATPase subunit K